MRISVGCWSLALLLSGCDRQGPQDAFDRAATPPQRVAAEAPVVLDNAPADRVDTTSAPVGAAPPENFTALGTEPFWSARVDGTGLVYRTPENGSGERIVVTRRAIGAQAEFSGTLGGDPLTLSIGAGPCSDGMSDTVYSHSAELRIGRQVLKGCAKP